MGNVIDVESKLGLNMLMPALGVVNFFAVLST